MTAGSGLRVAFVESRDKTELFESVARTLPFEIHWLVQNAVFTPEGPGEVYVMPYPKRRRLLSEGAGRDGLKDKIFQRVQTSDRVVLYFGRSTDHYDWYYEEITRWFDRVRPDVIFGEAGAFFSHIVALIADARGIPFLNPLSSRYPTGRFAFFEGDRLVPVGGESNPPDEVAVGELVADINAGRVRPDYMSAARSKRDALVARLRLLVEYWRGERFTAQSPLLFVRSSRALARSRARWDAAATPVDQLVSTGAKAVLFPLQLQPEMNLDVWGVAHRDQNRLMIDLADSLGKHGYELWVKPNPKSFYELSPTLCQSAIDHPSIRMIAHSVRMPEVVDAVDLVVTVSGSVAIERLLKRDSVAVLHPDYASWIGAPNVVDLGLTPRTLDDASVSTLAERSQDVEPTTVLRNLIATSYRGVISEPSYTPGVVSVPNVELIALAMKDVISQLQAAGRIRRPEDSQGDSLSN